MPFSIFKERVLCLIRREGLTARFSTDGGKHIAMISDGTIIVGNQATPKIAVKWGDGHMAFSSI